MRRWLGLWALAALAVGCQPSAQTTPPPQEPEEAPAPAVQAPRTEEPTRVALLRNGQVVDVGSDPERALEVFRGDKPGGFVTDRLPPGFHSPYRARIWQGASEGFGVLTFNGKVVAAMHQQQGVSQEQLNALVAAYRERTGMEGEFIGGDRVSYWFWTDAVTREGTTIGEQRLMVMAFQGGRDGVFLTTAMGDTVVLDALGVSPRAARDDQVKADQILLGQDARANAQR